MSAINLQDISSTIVRTPEQLELGEEIRAGLLSRLAECRMIDRWPGRYSEPQTLEMPSYLFEELEVSYVE